MSPPVPTWRLVAGAAAGSLAVLLLPVRPPLGLWVVNGLLLAGAVADWLLAVRPGELGVERELPGIVPLGAEARVTWRIGHRPRPRGAPGGQGPGGPGPVDPHRERLGPRGRGVRVRLADELAPSLGAVTRRVRVVVPPGGRAVAATTISPSRRGRFTPTEVVLRVEKP